jgi:lysophospholipase L1-like esterase
MMVLQRVSASRAGRVIGMLMCTCLAMALAACGGGGDGGGGDGGSAPSPASSAAVPASPVSSAAVPASPAPAPAPAGPAASPPSSTAQTLYHAAWTASLLDAQSATSGLTPPQALTLSNQTLRQTLRLAIGGNSFRLRLSNMFGTAPLAVSAVRVARSAGGSGIDASTDRTVSFDGKASIMIGPGNEVLSDPVSLSAPALAQIAVSMVFAAPASVATAHPYVRDAVYVASGDQGAAQFFPAGAQSLFSNYTLSAVEAADTDAARVVVAFGDSITEGVHSTQNAEKNYPEQLNHRLQAAGFTRTGVVNAGIAGNRWLADGVGPSGIKRFERDALSVAGATHIILLLGVNDLSFSGVPGTPDEVSADQLIAAMTDAANQARSRGLRVIAGTLTPFAASGATETKRQALNAWIRSGVVFDGIIDFDAALRAPTDPAALNPLYNSGDGLHPNDAGYSAMATAVNLSLLL